MMLLTASVRNTVVPIVSTLIALVVLIVYSARLVKQVNKESYPTAEALARVVAVVIAAWALLYVPGVNVIMAIVVAVLVTTHASGGESSASSASDDDEDPEHGGGEAAQAAAPVPQKMKMGPALWG